METLDLIVSQITENNDYQREQAASAHAAAQRLWASLRVIYGQDFSSGLLCHQEEVSNGQEEEKDAGYCRKDHQAR
jgi:hypothetical protein